MNKRVTAFKDKYGKQGSVLSGKMAQEIKPAQHKLIRELIAQVAIQCGIIGAPQTGYFKQKGDIYKLKKVFENKTSPRASLVADDEASIISQSSDHRKFNTQPSHLQKTVEICAANFASGNNNSFLGKLSMSKQTQTVIHAIDKSWQASITHDERRLECEKSLAQLIEKVNGHKSDLKLKIDASKKRKLEKEELLTILEQKSSKDAQEINNPEVSNTQSQLADVISKEVFIQGDL